MVSFIHGRAIANITFARLTVFLRIMAGTKLTVRPQQIAEALEQPCRFTEIEYRTA